MDNSHSTLVPGIKRHMSHDWCDDAASTAVTSKDSGALVDTHMWDTRITSVIPSFTPPLLSKFRRYVLTYKFTMLYKEFITFMSNKHKNSWTKFKMSGGFFKTSKLRGDEGELGKDLIAGKKVLYNYFGSSYQGWDSGSALIFGGGLTMY